jgi:hypothetical protein
VGNSGINEPFNPIPEPVDPFPGQAKNQVCANCFNSGSPKYPNRFPEGSKLVGSPYSGQYFGVKTLNTQRHPGDARIRTNPGQRRSDTSRQALDTPFTG